VDFQSDALTPDDLRLNTPKITPSSIPTTPAAASAAPDGRIDFAGPIGCGCRAIYRRDGGRLRHELLDGKIFYTLNEAKVVIESWRRHYNTLRPHGSQGYRQWRSNLCCQTLSSTGWESPRFPANVNPLNRPVRTRMPGGVAGDTEGLIQL
jgi:hypothetical protein